MTDDNTEIPEVTSLLVRSTVHLPEIGMGAVVHVDPRSPYIAGCLERGFLVEEPTAAEPSEPESQEQLVEADSADQREEEVRSDQVDPELEPLEDAAAAESD